MLKSKAIKILKPIVTDDFSKENLVDVGLYLSAEAGKDKATLDGEFTADQLEAIAAWIREPFDSD
jgi:hypothetical protein